MPTPCGHEHPSAKGLPFVSSALPALEILLALETLYRRSSRGDLVHTVWNPGQAEVQECAQRVTWDCLGVLSPFSCKRCPSICFLSSWIAGRAPDAKLPRLCMEFRSGSNGTFLGPKQKKKSKLLIACPSRPEVMARVLYYGCSVLQGPGGACSGELSPAWGGASHASIGIDGQPCIHCIGGAWMHRSLRVILLERMQHLCACSSCDPACAGLCGSSAKLRIT